MIEPKDVVIAILGSSAGLGGFVLVFLGVIIASYQSFQGAVPAAGPADAYGLTVGLFVVQLVAVFAAAAWVTRMVLWR